MNNRLLNDSILKTAEVPLSIGRPQESDLRQKASLFLVTIFLLEVSIGGSGQIFKLYEVPVRQLLFVLIALFYFLEVFTSRTYRSSSNSRVIVYSIFTWSLVSGLIGFMRGHDPDLVIGDIKPMLFFLIFRPLACLIKTSRISLHKIVNVFIISALIISLMSLGLYFLIYLKLIGDRYYVQTMLDQMFGDGVIRTRPNGSVSYDGLVYLVVGLSFCYSRFVNGRGSVFVLAVLVLSVATVIFSLTKGIILASFISLATISAVNFKSLLKTRAPLAVALSVLVLYALSQNTLDFDRLFYENISGEDSFNVRVVTYNDASAIINTTGVFGAGFGQEIAIRPAHLENTYLDVLMEQGVIGMLLYLALVLYIFVQFRNAYRQSRIEKYIIDGLLGGYLALLFLTATNPYINNPLGISYLLLLLILLDLPVQDRHDHQLA